MPETAYLSILHRSRESDPARVVDLHGATLRIGRAAFCDIRLDDPQLADEECRIRRRGRDWQVVPSSGSRSIAIDGKPILTVQSLPFDGAFTIGEFSITLCLAVGFDPARREAGFNPGGASTTTDTDTIAARHRAERVARADEHDRTLHVRRETKRWESRWKAAGERIRAANANLPISTPTPLPSATNAEVPRSVPRVATTPLGFGKSRSFPATGGYKVNRPIKPTIGVDKLVSRRAQTPPPSPSQDHVRPAATTWREVATPALPPTPQRQDLPSAVSFVESDDFLRQIDSLTSGPESAHHVGVCHQLPPFAAPVSADLIPHGSADFALSRPDERPCEADAPIADQHRSEPAVECEEESGDLPEEVPSLILGSAYRLGDSTVSEEAPDIARSDPETIDVPFEKAASAYLAQEVSISNLAVEVTSYIPAESVETVADRWPKFFGSKSQRPRTEAAVAPPVFPQVHVSAKGTVESPEEPGLGDTPTLRHREPAHPFRVVEERRGPEYSAFEKPSRDSREWPRVSDILAAQGSRARPRPTEHAATARSTASVAKSTVRPAPTVVREPGTWSLPLWLALPPAAAAAVMAGTAGLFAGWTWTMDGYDAQVVARRLADPAVIRDRLPDGVAAPRGGWWSTSANSLVHWAVYFDRTSKDDPARLDDARALLDRAGNASPLHASVLYAKGQSIPKAGERPPELARVLGQSRDIATLAASGRQLLAAGKKPEALHAYTLALAMAAHSDLTRRITPVFLDDSETVRYGLPNEDQVGPLIREMARAKAWSYSEWSVAVPRGTVATLAAARALKDQGGSAFQAALDAAMKDTESPSDTGESTRGSAVRLAARAEVLALQDRWADARDVYRQAVAAMPVENVRRSWWLNLATIALRLNEEADRQKALEAAKNSDPNDEITRRVVEIQKKAGYAAQRSVARGNDAIAGKNPSAN